MRITELEMTDPAHPCASINYRLKMFVHKDPAAAEKEVTQWLLQNSVALHHVTQSQSERGGSFMFVLSLFYTDANN